MRERFHGLPFTSIPWNGFWSSCGNSPRTMTRFRRMSTILSTYEIITGHCSSQARQVVHAQSTSGWMTSGTRLIGFATLPCSSALSAVAFVGGSCCAFACELAVAAVRE